MNKNERFNMIILIVIVVVSFFAGRVTKALVAEAKMSSTALESIDKVTSGNNIHERYQKMLNQSAAEEQRKLILEHLDKWNKRLDDWHRWIELKKEGKLTAAEVLLLAKGTKAFEEKDLLIIELRIRIEELGKRVREYEKKYLEEISKDL